MVHVGKSMKVVVTCLSMISDALSLATSSRKDWLVRRRKRRAALQLLKTGIYCDSP